MDVPIRTAPLSGPQVSLRCLTPMFLTRIRMRSAMGLFSSDRPEIRFPMCDLSGSSIPQDCF